MLRTFTAVALATALTLTCANADDKVVYKIGIPKSFFRDLPSVLRGTLVSYWWFYYVDQANITADNVERVHKNIATLAPQFPGELINARAPLPHAHRYGGLGPTGDLAANGPPDSFTNSGHKNTHVAIPCRGLSS